MIVTLERFLQSDDWKNFIITIKILKCIEKDTYIVADESKMAILSTSGRLWLDEDLATGYWYILMRCTKGVEKHEVKCHKLFKPIKMCTTRKCQNIGNQN